MYDVINDRLVKLCAYKLEYIEKWHNIFKLYKLHIRYDSIVH